MEYELSIRDHNKQAHLDIEKDIKAKGNGLFTFILRVNNGNIVDYNLMEYTSGKTKYLGITKVVIKKSTLTYHNRK